MKKNIFFVIGLQVLLLMGIQSCDDAGIVTNQGSLYLRMDGTNAAGEDAYITDTLPSVPIPNSPFFGASAWMGTVNAYKGRTLFKFALSQIPSNATITNATLQLFAAWPWHTGFDSNACYIRKVTSAWDDSTATWATMWNASDLTDQVSVPASTNYNDNYVINVTNLVQTLVSNPTTNYGMMLLLQNETPPPNRALDFASSENADSTKRPLLTVSYTYTK